MTDETETDHDQTDDEVELSDETIRDLIGQKRRQDAFENGEYELSDDEGFHCTNCDWRGLTAPLHNQDPEVIVQDDITICMCPECEHEVETYGTSTEYIEPFVPDELPIDHVEGDR